MEDQVVLKFAIRGVEPPLASEVEFAFNAYQAQVFMEDDVYCMELMPGDVEDYGDIVRQIGAELEIKYPGTVLLQ